jgi:hypothetical protein
MKKMNQTSLIGIIVLTLVALAVGYVFGGLQIAKTVLTQSHAPYECSNIGADWSSFSNSHGVSFCYPTAWGKGSTDETGISPSARIGTTFYTDFDKGPFGLLAYSTMDFRKLGDSDVPDFDWSIVDFTKSNADLKKAFHGTAVETTTLTIAGRKVLRVQYDFLEPLGGDRWKSVDYYIPNVLIQGVAFNLHITAAPESLAAMEKLLETWR